MTDYDFIDDESTGYKVVDGNKVVVNGEVVGTLESVDLAVEEQETDSRGFLGRGFSALKSWVNQ